MPRPGEDNMTTVPLGQAMELARENAALRRWYELTKQNHPYVANRCHGTLDYRDGLTIPCELCELHADIEARAASQETTR